MYQFYQNTLTIPAKALYEDLDVMSESNYKKQCHVGRIKKVRTGGGYDKTALVDFDSIPERFRVKIVKILGYPPKKTEQNLILQYFKDDYEAIDFFASYQLDDYRTLDPEKQEEYVINAQMLDAINTFIKETQSFVKGRNGRRNLMDIWKDAVQATKDVQDHTGHTLPLSVRRLKEKLEDYKRDGYSVLISENFGNKKASKVRDDQQEAVLRELFRKHQNYDNEQIATDYNTVASALCWDMITASTVLNYRKKWNFSTLSYREGAKAFDNKIKMQIKRKAPEFPMAFWVMDGWKAELMYQKFENGKTSYHHRLLLEVVLDPSTKYPIGYAIGESENADLIKAALRNAVNHTEELFGYKHNVYQIQADNFASKVMAPIYKGVAKNYIPTKVGNAKSKVIEPWFNWFNKTHCQREANWSGHGLKSKQQPNAEFLQSNKKNFPTEEQAYEQLERLINQARADNRDAYVKAYLSAPEDLKDQLSDVDFLKFLGVKKPDTSKFRGEGMVFRVNKMQYTFDTFDIEFRNHLHLDWNIFFDPQNMTKVLAYNEDKNLQFELEEKYIQPMDLYTQEREDRLEMHKVRKFNNYLEMKVLKEFADDADIIDELVFNNKVIEETAKKVLITDSLGQHKNQTQGAIAEKARRKVEKIEAKIEKQNLQDQEQIEDEKLRQKRDYDKYLKY